VAGIVNPQDMKKAGEQTPCRLCTEDKPLCESHLMSSGIYKYCYSDDSPPVMFNSRIMMQTNREVKDRLLCFDCEQRLNRGGENWLVPLLARVDGTFPICDYLLKATPLFDEPDFKLRTDLRL
jgi:hypothetical protein